MTTEDKGYNIKIFTFAFEIGVGFETTSTSLGDEKTHTLSWPTDLDDKEPEESEKGAFNPRNHSRFWEIFTLLHRFGLVTTFEVFPGCDNTQS